MSVIKNMCRSGLAAIAGFLKQTSWRQRLLFMAPFLAAAALAALALAGQIYLHGRGLEGIVGAYFHSFLLMALFLCPLCWVSARFLPGLIRRLPLRRATDALLIGLYLPHLFVTLFILKTQFTDADSTVRISSAIAAWAMFFLLLTPVCLVFVFLIWTFLPKPKETPLVEAALSPEADTHPPVQTPAAEQDSAPPQNRWGRIAGFRRKA